MKAGRPRQDLTDRELQLMTILWDNPQGLPVKTIVALHPDPRPHVNSVATILKILEEKGHVTHRSVGGAHIFTPLTQRQEAGRRSISSIVSNFFGNSYKNVVSALVDDNRLSVDELREIISLIEQRDNLNNSDQPDSSIH